MLARPIGHMAFTQVLLPLGFGMAWKGRLRSVRSATVPRTLIDTSPGQRTTKERRVT